MPNEPRTFSLKIFLMFCTFTHFQRATAFFDSWKATQDTSSWTSSGWILESETHGRLFINSEREIDRRAVDLLIKEITHSCLAALPEYRVIDL